MRKYLIGAALAALTASGALAAPTFIHAGRLIAVPGKPARGPSTIVVDNGRIVSVADGLARIVEASSGFGPPESYPLELRDETASSPTAAVLITTGWPGTALSHQVKTATPSLAQSWSTSTPSSAHSWRVQH